ncbi:hypothetical protein [Campylobacter sp. RM12651]|uniref:hypothetical protein n=1 Tax=Campylobacter sp. RM12651 TaxID=1660079 RepID=UPI001EFC0977|nr:hypothetical protein [Campylobacter sp. RM12651]ULO04538.1 hypothetical protein AVBRAN_a0056 [Campylobacter sp. RM12651]
MENKIIFGISNFTKAELMRFFSQEHRNILYFILEKVVSFKSFKENLIEDKHTLILEQFIENFSKVEAKKNYLKIFNTLVNSFQDHNVLKNLKGDLSIDLLLEWLSFIAYLKEKQFSFKYISTILEEDENKLFLNNMRRWEYLDPFNLDLKNFNLKGIFINRYVIEKIKHIYKNSEKINICDDDLISLLKYEMEDYSILECFNFTSKQENIILDAFLHSKPFSLVDKKIGNCNLIKKLNLNIELVSHFHEISDFFNELQIKINNLNVCNFLCYTADFIKFNCREKGDILLKNKKLFLKFFTKEKLKRIFFDVGFWCFSEEDFEKNILSLILEYRFADYYNIHLFFGLGVKQELIEKLVDNLVNNNRSTSLYYLSKNQMVSYILKSKYPLVFNMIEELLL